MTRHPGDPKSDNFGEQQFDPNEYPAVRYDPPNQPPPPGNVNSFTPYRSHEQHGVPFEESGPDFAAMNGYAKAHEDIVGGVYQVRDLVPVHPVQVAIVENPTLTQPRHCRCMSFQFAPSATYAWNNVVQEEKLRKRCVITATGSAGGAATVRISDRIYAVEPNSAFHRIATGTEVVLLDTVAQQGFFVWVVTATDPFVIVSVTTEYFDYQGAPLVEHHDPTRKK